MEIRLTPEYDSHNSHPTSANAVKFSSLRDKDTRFAARVGLTLDDGRTLGFDANDLADALRALGVRWPQ